MTNINFTNDNVMEAAIEAIKYFDIPQARRILKYLDSETANLSDGQVAKNYNSVIFQLRYLLLPTLDQEEIVNLFSHQIVDAIKNEDIDLVERLRARLIEIDFFDDRDAFKKQLMVGLQNNNELLTSRNFIESTDDKLPTVMNWLRRYQEFVGTREDSVKRAEFFVKYNNYLQLDDKEKVLVKKLINLYEFLKLSSSDPRALWEEFILIDEGRIKSLNRDGKIEIIGQVNEEDEDREFKKAEIEFERITRGLIDSDNTLSAKEDVINNEKPATPPQAKAEFSPQVSRVQPVEPTVKAPNIIKQTTTSTPFIHPIPESFKSTKPALIFNMEDEKEIDKHRAKAGSTPIILEHVIRAFVDEIIEQKNLIFRDEVNQRRFVQLMVSRLKDVRGRLEIAEVLRKPIESGGLGMSEEKSDQVLGIMEEAKREFESRLKNKKLHVPEPTPEIIPEPKPVEPPKPSFDAEAARAWRDQMLREIQSQSEPAPLADGDGTPKPVIKPQLSDIKAPPKVVGPLEELRGLTLVDFRRLGTTPQAALQKIRGKIDLLGETSIGRRLEAVRAWKSSVVYQQYLRLGRQSIEQGKPISVIVDNLKSIGEAGLTEEEFNAIADFNSKLRF